MENTHSRPWLRGDRHGRHRPWSPFSTTIWSSVELAFLSGQMIAALVVLTLSRHKNPQTPLFAWIVGYATRCVACLHLLYWRYLHRHQHSFQNKSEADQQYSCVVISFTPSDEESGQPQNPPSLRFLNTRLIAVVDYFKIAPEFFFVVWVGVGFMWITGGNTDTDAPNLYSLSTVFLTLSCLEYSTPFLLCVMIRCCLPHILSVMGIQEDVNQVRGASEEYINALLKHVFQIRSDVEEGRVVAAGSEEERAISAEDAIQVCCICLQSYTKNDELRELPCSHFFHSDCVDQWLKINAACPLCNCGS